MTEYVRAWPELEPDVVRPRQGAPMAVKLELRKLAATAHEDGALNLPAQLEREDALLDGAETSISRAIASNPNQDLHHFQQAMIFYARPSQVSGTFERWGWHRKTGAAYQRAFELNQRPVP